MLRIATAQIVVSLCEKGSLNLFVLNIVFCTRLFLKDTKCEERDLNLMLHISYRAALDLSAFNGSKIISTDVA